jgi:hypothetical protein
MTDVQPPGAAEPPRRGRRRVVAWTGVGVLVLTGSLLGLDRASAAVTEHVTAGKVQKCLQTADRPHVHISDFPLLPHLFSGRLDHLTLTARDANAKGVRVADLQVDAQGVSRHGAGGTAQSLRGTGMVSYDAISANAMGLRRQRHHPARRRPRPVQRLGHADPAHRQRRAGVAGRRTLLPVVR